MPFLFQHRQCFAVLGLMVVLLLGNGCKTLEEGLTSNVIDPVSAHQRVAELVGENYFDPEFRGRDWNIITETHKDSVVNTTDYRHTYLALKKMVNELGDAHTFVLAPHEVQQSKGSLKIGTGMITTELSEQKIVAQVLPNSPAERAGIQKGWIILEDGSTGWDTRYRFLDPTDHVIERTISPELIENESEQRYSALLEEDTLYLRFDSFDTGLTEWILKEVQKHPKTDKLIIDLRWNLGGRIKELDQLFPYLLQKGTKLGTLVSRNQSEEQWSVEVDVQSPIHHWSITLLTGERTSSCSEILASVLQHHGKAKVIAQNLSAGKVLISPNWPLAGGGVLQISTRNYINPSGNALEGLGVRPDIWVKRASLEQLRKGIDPVLQTALLEI